MAGRVDRADLADLLLRHPFADEQPLLHDANHSWTAGEARLAVLDGAADLEAAGVAEGRPVAVRSTGVPALLAMAAVWHHGAVSVPINDRLPPDAVEQILVETDVAAVLTPDGIEVRGAGRPHAPGAAFVLWTSGTSGAPPPIVHHPADARIRFRQIPALLAAGHTVPYLAPAAPSPPPSAENPS